MFHDVLVRHRPVLMALAAACAAAPNPAAAQRAEASTDAADRDAAVKAVGVVTVTGSGRPTALPTSIPTTMESVSAAQIERSINASDSEDALKYLPSLLVRKRYVGDYNHAVLSSRASGTGNSARSAVYADGMLLSNYLGNGVGGLSFPPRWGLVTPEEIERVDVMYGPFSAAYPGNSVGAVVVYTTRMPTAFEAHAKVGASSQPFSLYGTDATYRAWESSVGFGDRVGAWSWRLDASHTDSHGQPLTFATRLRSAGAAGGPGTPVSGAVLDANNAGSPWFVLGTGTEYRTQQDQFKAKLAWDLTPTLRASYVLGLWRNRADGRPASYLRDAAGNPVTAGAISIDGLSYSAAQALGGADFALTAERLQHQMQGLALKSHTRGVWDWEVDLSHYRYDRDDKRQNAAANTLPSAAGGGAGTLADGAGTGWVNGALKGSWRPQGVDGAHSVDMGLQADRYTLRYLTSNLSGNWLSDGAGTLAGSVQGHTALRSVYAQDAWTFAPLWKTVLGLRAEQWSASDGVTAFSATSAQSWPARSARYLSPKGALAWQAGDALVLKTSLARAVRMPTVSELYGATSSTNAQFINDPNLSPERSWTGEFSAEQDLANGTLRLTLFGEDTRDALYTQTSYDDAAGKNISRVQNVGRIATRGLEAAYSGSDVGVRGLDLSASATYADSIIKANGGFVATPGDTIGKWQPNIPKWRASLLAAWRFDERFSVSAGWRYSGQQYRTLNNADTNGHTYQGVSAYATGDLRLHLRVNRQWRAALGIDNVNNDKFWNFHPYPQRSVHAELRFDL